MRKGSQGRIGRQLASLGLVLALSGCTLPSSMMELIPTIPTLPSASSLFPSFGSNADCAVVSPKALKQVNWARVPEVNMRIRNDEFEPMIVQMTQGWPYTFRISNRDDRAHTFNAQDFFKSVAMIRITIDGVRQDQTCFASVEIPAQKTAEMQLVAAVDGHFVFKDNWLPAASLLSGGADGVIIVQERRKARRD